MSGEWGNWGRQAVEHGTRSEGHERGSGRKTHKHAEAFYIQPLIDETLLSYAFKDILLPGQARTPRERAKWLLFWEEALECELGSVRLIDRENHVVYNDDIQSRELCLHDQWFTFKLAEILLELHPHEEPSRLWRQILESGPSAYQWIEHFFLGWLRNGLHNAHTERFISEWKSMISHAAALPYWRDREICWRHGDRFWLHLMGFGQYQRTFWHTGHARVIESMVDEYARYVPEHLTSSLFTNSFLRWLQVPSAARVRPLALIWVLDVAQTADEYWWEREENTKILAEIMNVCWKEDKTAITSDSEAGRSFKKLLSILVKRQNPLAMDLQERMSRLNVQSMENL